MELKEAEKIIEILLCADGGCEFCAYSLIEMFCEEFPQYKELAWERYNKTFKKEK